MKSPANRLPSKTARFTLVFTFSLLLLAALFFHAMLVPWIPLWCGSIYELWPVDDVLYVWGPFDRVVDCIGLILVFGWVLCASLPGVLLGACMLVAQVEGVSYCLTRRCN